MSSTRGSTSANRDGKRHRGTYPRHHDLPMCPVSRKVSFASRAKARKALGGTANSKRVYRCPDCPYWHTTSSRRRRPAVAN